MPRSAIAQLVKKPLSSSASQRMLMQAQKGLEEIDTQALVMRLQQFALARPDDTDDFLTKGQVDAIRLLLSKTLPDAPKLNLHESPSGAGGDGARYISWEDPIYVTAPDPAPVLPGPPADGVFEEIAMQPSAPNPRDASSKPKAPEPSIFGT
jgi:hypothetical protein